jgi:hypothetical protein
MLLLATANILLLTIIVIISLIPRKKIEIMERGKKQMKQYALFI